MPAVADHIHSNIKQVKEDAENASKQSKLFVLTRHKKDEAPLDNFLAYYAFKTEERKFYERYPNQHPNADEIKDSLSAPIPY